MPISFEVAPVDVVNEALGILGKDFIINLDDTTDPVAVKCKRYYASILRTMLRDHPFRFAMRRRELAWTGIRPVSEWAYAFALPAECVRVWKVNGSDRSVWKIEGRDLLMNESRAIIEYNQWITDPNIFDGAFYQAFVTGLSFRLAPAFDSDMAKSSDLFKLFVSQVAEAKAISAQEGSLETMECPDLTDAIRE